MWKTQKFKAINLYLSYFPGTINRELTRKLHLNKSSFKDKVDVTPGIIFPVINLIKQ